MNFKCKKSKYFNLIEKNQSHTADKFRFHSVKLPTEANPIIEEEPSYRNFVVKSVGNFFNRLQNICIAFFIFLTIIYFSACCYFTIPFDRN